MLFLNSIAGKYSGEIRNSSEKSNLKSQLAGTISQLFDEITKKFVTELADFREKRDPIKNGFANNLLIILIMSLILYCSSLKIRN